MCDNILLNLPFSFVLQICQQNFLLFHLLVYCQVVLSNVVSKRNSVAFLMGDPRVRRALSISRPDAVSRKPDPEITSKGKISQINEM